MKTHMLKITPGRLLLCVAAAVPPGLVWAVQAKRQDGLVLLLWSVLLLFMAAAAWKDFREKRVENSLVASMLGAWVLLMVPQLFLRTEAALFFMLNGGIGFLLGGVLFLLVYMVSRKGLGGGDVKLMAVAGLYLGAEAALASMLFGSLLAGAAGAVLLLLRKIGKRDSIPLVPFLYFGMLTAMLTQGGYV